MFYKVDAVMALLGISKSKAFEIIRQLRTDLEADGYILPPAGKIQKRYFCKRFDLDLQECEDYLSTHED